MGQLSSRLHKVYSSEAYTRLYARLDAAENLTRAMGGRWYSSYGMVCCPAHEDHTPSLQIADGESGRLLLYCFAGCAFEEVLAILQDLGLVGKGRRPENGLPTFHSSGPKLAPPSPQDAAARMERAVALWRDSRSAAGTLVERYLATRGLKLPPGDALRFHPSLKHRSGARWPAMVALVTRGTDAAPLGVHRTFLARDGSGKAPVDEPKMMLGPCRGGVVRLAEASEQIMVGEGLETCLSVMQALGGRPTWSALSTSGLRSLMLPASVRDVIILADNDPSGASAAREAARRWLAEGRRVRIARPPSVKDFNDLLRGSLQPLLEGQA